MDKIKGTIHPRAELRRLEVQMESIGKKIKGQEELVSERERIRQKILGLRLFLGEATEPVKFQSRGRRGKGSIIREAADRILRSHPEGLYYMEMLTALTNEGIQVPGERPGLNLIAHLSLDPRFRNVGRGKWTVIQDSITGKNPNAQKKKRN